MSAFLKEVELFFGTTDLYSVLNVHKTASNAEIKRAYYKLSLTVHPDKAEVGGRDVATKKFQVLGKIYKILSDDDLSRIYSETGTVDEDNSWLEQERDWMGYWRVLFPKVTIEKIEKFANKYRNSKEEKDNLTKLYNDHEGDMGKIMDGMMLSSPDDEQRYRGIINGLIQSGVVSEYEGFSNESLKKKKARLARYKKEEREAKESLNECKVGKNDGKEESLQALITKMKETREKRADDLFTYLTDKYCKEESSKDTGGKATKRLKAKKNRADASSKRRKLTS